MAPIAIDPAVVVGLGPSGLLVKVAQAFGDTACPAILPVPDGPQGLEQALILKAVLAPEGLVKVFGPVSRPGDEGLDGRIELLPAAGHRLQTKGLAPVRMLLRPPVLRLDSILVPEGHHGKEEQQADLPVGIGPTSALGFRTGPLIGPERPAQEVDAVRKRGLGHRNTSFEKKDSKEIYTISKPCQPLIYGIMHPPQIVVWCVSLCPSCLW